MISTSTTMYFFFSFLLHESTAVRQNAFSQKWLHSLSLVLLLLVCDSTILCVFPGVCGSRGQGSVASGVCGSMGMSVAPGVCGSRGLWLNGSVAPGVCGSRGLWLQALWLRWFLAPRVCGSNDNISIIIIITIKTRRIMIITKNKRQQCIVALL